jgi:hypothetical protein
MALPELSGLGEARAGGRDPLGSTIYDLRFTIQLRRSLIVAPLSYRWQNSPSNEIRSNLCPAVVSGGTGPFCRPERSRRIWPRSPGAPWAMPDVSCGTDQFRRIAAGVFRFTASSMVRAAAFSKSSFAPGAYDESCWWLQHCPLAGGNPHKSQIADPHSTRIMECPVPTAPAAPRLHHRRPYTYNPAAHRK